MTARLCASCGAAMTAVTVHHARMPPTVHHICPGCVSRYQRPVRRGPLVLVKESSP